MEPKNSYEGGAAAWAFVLFMFVVLALATLGIAHFVFNIPISWLSW